MAFSEASQYNDKGTLICFPREGGGAWLPGDTWREEEKGVTCVDVELSPTFSQLSQLCRVSGCQVSLGSRRKMRIFFTCILLHLSSPLRFPPPALSISVFLFKGVCWGLLSTALASPTLCAMVDYAFFFSCCHFSRSLEEDKVMSSHFNHKSLPLTLNFCIT